MLRAMLSKLSRITLDLLRLRSGRSRPDLYITPTRRSKAALRAYRRRAAPTPAKRKANLEDQDQPVLPATSTRPSTLHEETLIGAEQNGSADRLAVPVEIGRDQPFTVMRAMPESRLVREVEPDGYSAFAETPLVAENIV